MVDDRLEDAGSPPDPGRVKRAPPTIDLEATEVSSETKPGPETPIEPKRTSSRISSRNRRPAAIRGVESQSPSAPDDEPERQRPRPLRKHRPFAVDLALGDRAVFRRGRSRAGDRGGLDAGLAAVQPPPAASPGDAAIDDLTAQRSPASKPESGKPVARSRARRAARRAGEIRGRLARRSREPCARNRTSWPRP